jgi:peptidoglycan/xylan/chitin deacetylase (PgdA/CDA1 family)
VEVAKKIGLALAGLAVVIGLAADSRDSQHHRTAHRVSSAAPAPPPTPVTPPRPPPPRVDCAKLKCVALTFDDGPGPDTARLLDLLARHHARATFFVLGPNAEEYKNQVRREHADGHEVGNHSMNHLQLNLQRRSTAKIKYEIEGAQKILKDILGFDPVLFRPPYGATNRRVSLETKREGLAQILWNVDTLDWQTKSPSTVARRAIRDMRPGSIILMHDIHPSTVDAVPRILDAIEDKGFTPVTVSELLGDHLKPGWKYYDR